ncbi:hypothetical protein ACFO0N_17600 [Halobium salinum]|uniref:Uncharacterized protein n=1 Tax=Halobium salinum TaxID=1364940 RepID=A0ABD5PG95_9EURY|nr:hypothetical protein [Halobium salinum]
MTDATDAVGAADADCEFCGCAVADHDPVFVAEGTDRRPTG